MDFDKVLKAERSKGGHDCASCENKIAAGEKVIAAEVTVGASFLKALQKTVRREAHLNCAMSLYAILGRKIAQAEAL